MSNQDQAWDDMSDHQRFEIMRETLASGNAYLSQRARHAANREEFRRVQGLLESELFTSAICKAAFMTAMMAGGTVEDAMVYCIKSLAKQNRQLTDFLLAREWERPTIIHVDGKTLTQTKEGE